MPQNRYVTFGTYRSDRDLNMILLSWDIPKPEQKRSSIDIPGSHGVLDTTYFITKQPLYKNIAIILNFRLTKANVDDLYDAVDLISQVLHGKELDIFLGWRNGYHYRGNVQINSIDYVSGDISFKCDCKPWQLKDMMTTVSQTVLNAAAISLVNDRRWTAPTVRATGAMTLVFNDESYTLPADTDTVFSGLVLKDGTNTVNVTGNGTITFSYQEAKL